MIFSSTLTIISDVPYHLEVFGVTVIVRDVFGRPVLLRNAWDVLYYHQNQCSINLEILKKMFFHDFFSHFGSWRVALDRSPYCLGGVLGRKIVVLRAQEELWDLPLHRLVSNQP